MANAIFCNYIRQLQRYAPSISSIFIVVETPKASCSYSSAPINRNQEDEREYGYRQYDREPKEKAEPSIGSPARIQKLIASQTDPLLAKEIFDLASRQPNFRHSYATYHTLILKLGRSRHFSLMNAVISSLKSLDYSISPSLFTHIIQIYGDANQPEKALKTFYTILEFNIKPRQKHLNCILEILVANSNFLRAAFDLFRAAHRYGVSPNTNSYKIMMRAFCLNGDLSIAYTLFNHMFKRDVLPDVESYRILMQALCRKSQVNKAVDLLEDMLNKGFVPDSLSYTTLLNSLCRKKKLKEAYKLLCRMKIKGCNPDIVHYNTVISVGGLCNQGMYDEAKRYIKVMLSKEFHPHFSVIHMLVQGFCKLGKLEDACEVLSELLRHGSVPHTDTWAEIVARICEEEDAEALEEALKQAVKVEIKSDTRLVDAGAGLEEYLMRKIKSRSRPR
ncbi:pentatricopeptide repeat-containing protein At4g01400, mitochondrial isoform X2 [Salvia hispanica]|uniref:pentatricopeptide repeat-containing protein At4g01400, mitochondrial isoform X2 n=1 Tax=Salvia hispanica TaxID=49212 RepID=UPI00200984D9|nr:pentatricopeptide repeat-containing protein At4g01400, mitochondrial isoform X2 [Salvia hispanica]